MNLTALIKKLAPAALLLLAIPLWLNIIAPNRLRLADEFKFEAEVISVDNFYDLEAGAFKGEEFSRTTFEYKTLNATAESLVIANIFDVRTIDGAPIFSVTREYGINRYTGEHIPSLGNKERVGYLFAPRHLEEGEAFTYWHVNYDGPAQMEYVGREVLYGLPVFHYQTSYEGVTIDQTTDLDYLPNVGETWELNLSLG